MSARLRGAPPPATPLKLTDAEVENRSKLDRKKGSGCGAPYEWMGAYDASLQRIGITEQTFDTLIEESNAVSATDRSDILGTWSMVLCCVLVFPLVLTIVVDDVAIRIICGVVFVVGVIVLYVLCKKWGVEKGRVDAAYEEIFAKCRAASGEVAKIEIIKKSTSGDAPSDFFLVISGTPGAAAAAGVAL
jgi:hypothetical protein